VPFKKYTNINIYFIFYRHKKRVWLIIAVEVAIRLIKISFHKSKNNEDDEIK
jgi:hypothetical protein